MESICLNLVLKVTKHNVEITLQDYPLSWHKREKVIRNFIAENGFRINGSSETGGKEDDIKISEQRINEDGSYTLVVDITSFVSFNLFNVDIDSEVGYIDLETGEFFYDSLNIPYVFDKAFLDVLKQNVGASLTYTAEYGAIRLYSSRQWKQFYIKKESE